MNDHQAFCYPDLTKELMASLPKLRGRLRANQSLSQITWFRVGGPAQLFFLPADEEDLAYCLAALPDAFPVTIIGAGSNLLIRDGGLPGLTLRLTPSFADYRQEKGWLSVGAALLDSKLAMIAQQEALKGFAFYRGIPGTIGGALTMNAGALGGETSQLLTGFRALTLRGEVRDLPASALHLSYRHSQPDEPLIFTRATYLAEPGDREKIAKEVEAALAHRDQSQPVKSRTGGSTFKNPPGLSAWQLIDKAGCRGLARGAAQVSEQHCNFLINHGGATADDIEALGEEVRQRVFDSQGVELIWEIKRLGLSCEQARLVNGKSFL